MMDNSNIVLWGGEIDTSQQDLSKFLELWDLSSMPYTILDTMHNGKSMVLADALNGLQPDDLLRLHVFGVGGDLMLRRDRARILWRFVGWGQAGLTESAFEIDPYPEALVVEHVDEYRLLWGEYDSERGTWYNNRVRRASVEKRLDYPLAEDSPPDHVRMSLRTVWDAATGETVAYWATGIAGTMDAEEESDGSLHQSL